MTALAIAVGLALVLFAVAGLRADRNVWDELVPEPPPRPAAPPPEPPRPTPDVPCVLIDNGRERVRVPVRTHADVAAVVLTWLHSDARASRGERWVA